MKLLVLTALVAGAIGMATPSYASTSNVQHAICVTFGSQCSKALRVAWCESHFSTGARNGQYLGIFQMGSHERAMFGFGRSAWAQARAAKNYYDWEVRHHHWGWTPWDCA